MASLVLISLFFVVQPRASAQSLGIAYYAIPSSDADANNLSFGTVDNKLQNALGPDGLPALNTPLYGCTSNCFSLASGPTNLTASGEITYWDPARNSYITEPGAGTVSLPFSLPSNFFLPNGTGSGHGGSNGYQAAVLYGGPVLLDKTSTISGGTTTPEALFVDINHVQSGLRFGTNTSNVATTLPRKVPEPATITLFGLGLAAIAFKRRKAA